MILNMAEALEVAGDAFARDITAESEAARARLRATVREAAGMFRREAARLGAPVGPRLVVDEPESPLAPVIPFPRPGAEA
jgi:hypothetical protein